MSAEVTAIGCSVRCIVADGRELVFQYHIADDASDAEINQRLDRLMAFGDRQALRCERPALIEERATLESAIAQYAKDLEAVEADWQADNNERMATIERLEGEARDVHDEAYQEHVKTGRAAEFKPRGNTESRLRGFAVDIAKLKVAIEKSENERNVARQNLEIALNARKGRIALIDEKLARIDTET